MLQRIVIPELTGGVSRQPDGQRFPNQVESADNVNLHLARGLEKRAGSQVVHERANLNSDLGVHWINRSSTQRYLVTYRESAGTPIVITKIDGTACTLTWNADGYAKTYVVTAPANLRLVTVDDTTIIVNTTIDTAVDAAVVSYDFGGTAVENNGNAHNKDSWEDFDLPPLATTEYWYAKGDALGHSAGWYESQSITAQPWYKRIRAPQAGSVFDVTSPNTMPVRITQTGDTTFVGEVISWNPRLSGDSLTNAGPSFVGKKITDVCVHRNRLWFSAGENVCGSASGEFYNFWNDSYDQVVDSDPIDVKLSSTQVTRISWMMGFQRAIVIFTESGQQYEIRAKEALTPTTVQITPSTAYTSPSVRPIIVGSQLYWVAPKGPWAQVYEYLTDEAAAQSVATDSAAHVDGYIASTVAEMKASSSNDLLFARMGDNTVFVNFMFWQGQKKIQSSWCRWVFPTDQVILGLEVFDDYLYTFSRVEGTTLRIDKVPLRNSDVNPSYTPRFDASTSVTGTWNAATKLTTFNISAYIPLVNSAYYDVAWTTEEGLRFVPAVVSSVLGTTVVTLNGRHDDHPVDFGILYDMDIQLSRQYVRDQQGVQAYGSLQLKQLTVHHRNTGFFELVIDSHTSPASDRHYKYTGKQLGSIGFITNTNVLSDRDSQNFKIMASSGGVDLHIKSDSPAPCNVTGMEFVADFVAGKRSAAST